MSYQTDTACDIITMPLTIRLVLQMLELLKIVLIAVIESIISWLVTRWLYSMKIKEQTRKLAAGCT